MDLTLETQPPEAFGDGYQRRTGRGTAGQLIYAIGDIHGRYDLLKTLLWRITEDYTARAEGRRPVIVFCGDYVDRGPQSAEVLDALVWLTRRADIELHLLKGNHEQGMLDFIADPARALGWLKFGGVQTLESYGVTPPAGPEDTDGLEAARATLLDRLPASHLLLLQRLELMITVGDYVFVHAGLRPGAALADQAEQDLLSIRGAFLDFTGEHEKMVVHGHTWLDAHPRLMPNRLGLDTGAYSTGVLTALRLEDDSLAVLQAQGEPGAFSR